MARDLLRLLICGSVDDGKSTLLGRLLLDAGLLPDDQRLAIERDSRRFGSTGRFDPALVTDGLRAEREQGITIDVAYRYFATPRRAFIVADAPGHEQYTRNMVSGASTAEAAIILVDVAQGLRVQTRRHAAILALLGVRHLIVVANKMDLVGFDRAPYETLCDDFRAFATRLLVSDVTCVPAAARPGDNVVTRSDHMPWYDGATLLHTIETLHVTSGRNAVDLRVPIQLAGRSDDGRRVYHGTVRSGILRPGDRVVLLPSRQPAVIDHVLVASGATAEGAPLDAVSIVFKGSPDVSRGDVVVHERNQPRVGRRIDAMLVWLGDAPCQAGGRVLIKHLTTTVPATLTDIGYRLNVTTLHRETATTLATNECGRCVFECDMPIAWDAYERNRATGGFIVIDRATNETIGAGMLVDRLPDVVDADGPAASAAQDVATIWMTGLSGAGKSTIAREVEQALRQAGRACVVLDGDAVRAGLNADLGFSAADRRENVRRLAEVARLFNGAGLTVIVPVIAPMASDRARAREIVGEGRFIEVFVDAPIEVCETRDVKGLYARARAGEIPEFTGVSSPYEPPEAPDLTLRTHEQSLAACVDAVLARLGAR